MTKEQEQLVVRIIQSAWKDYLKEKRWVAWFPKEQEGRIAKIPLGNHSDPNTWSTFDELCAKLKPGQGFGYNFLGGDLHPLDLDHVRNPDTGIICPEAMLLLSRVQTFSEISVSKKGIHAFFKGAVRGKELLETHVQYWHPQKSPRFFTVTGECVGEAFTTIKDIGDEFNYVFATARHISAKIREELRAVDYEQWVSLPAERVVEETTKREKPKTKTRKLASGFDIKDFLAFYDLPIANETDNELGHCIRLTTCPIKGEPHVGQNGTSTNFILSVDGGLGFHCQSTGCVDYSVSQVIEKLSKEKPYPKAIYLGTKDNHQLEYVYKLESLSDVIEKPLTWLWPGYLPDNQLVLFGGASSEGKSPVTRDLIARVTSGAAWPDGSKNEIGPRSVILLAGEDAIADKVKPELRLACADISKVKMLRVTAKKGDSETQRGIALDRDFQGLVEQASTLNDLALIVIDPITNYLGNARMNSEEEIRKILMPVTDFAQNKRVCIVTVGHLNKRGADAAVLQRVMGATAFVGVPRKLFLFSGDPEDTDKYTHVMKEERDKQVGLKYKTIKVEDPQGIQADGIVQVKWLGAVERDADEMVNQPKQREKSSNSEAKVVIKTLLRNGSKASSTIEQALKDAGIDCPKWQRVAKRIPATWRQVGKVYEWYLPAPEQAKFDETQPKSESA